MRIVMMGTGTFAEPTFEALIAAKEDVVGLVTQPERDSGNKRGSTRQTGRGMANIARDAGIPVFQPQSINTPEGLTGLADFRPDLLVVAAYGQILKPTVLAIPPQGAINVHASLLPRYRGASPIAHAILQGETETGVTIIRITPGLDAGEMLAQQSLAILPEETTGELEARLGPLGAHLCLGVVERMKQGPVAGEPQNPALVTRAPKFTKEMGDIDWSLPAARIACHIRAVQPWPTAYTHLLRPGKEPMRVIVQRARVLAGSAIGAPGDVVVGELVSAEGERVFRVCCGESTVLAIRELQPAGKKRMTAEEFVRGYPVTTGCKFQREAK